MGMKKEVVKLKCGIEITVFGEWNIAELDIYDLYNGYANPKKLQLNNFNLLSAIFKELDEMGYEGSGIETDIGYYDCVDGMKLNLKKKKI